MSFLGKRLIIITGCLLCANTLFAFSRQDTLRGSNGHGRNWWDVQQYKLDVLIDTATHTISGSNTIQFKVLGKVKDSMQIDLQEPMILDSAVLQDEVKVDFTREGSVYWLDYASASKQAKESYSITLFYHGKPREAVKPPWDGGFIWTKDSLGNPWISVACQGLGASSWWPCKDYQGDEPDKGTTTHFKVNMNQTTIVSNGIAYADAVIPGKALPSGFSYGTHNPINTYNTTFYLGDYIPWADTFQGVKGTLDISYYALKYHQEQAKAQFKQVKKMLEAFEYWFGPYPFYEDGYKIVEAPFLGMEHQSAIAYGNRYQMGYRGRDRSGTGVGLLFDFIIVHESGHEWFGNNITATDIADNWIHEGFTTYSETLFAEYWWGKEKAYAYTRGEWKNISNDRPVIGAYGVQDEGSGDKYDKASALVHTIRLLMNDDEKFRGMLHKMNDTFYHKQISSKQMEDFIIGYSGLPLGPIFNQYLRSTQLPELLIQHKEKTIAYKWKNAVADFTLPITLMIGTQKIDIQPSGIWQKCSVAPTNDKCHIVEAFLFNTRYID